MDSQNTLPLGLGLVIFSFLITTLLIVPFINLLYRLDFTRRKEAPLKGKVPLFDKLHDIKAGTPVGGGIIIILIVSVFFALLFPFASHMGVIIRSSFDLRTELFLIFFTFLSFGALGFSDDLLKLFGKPRQGALGMWIGISRSKKFIIQWTLALTVGYILNQRLGIDFINIPLVDQSIYLGTWYILFSAFVIVAFSNAFNVTDGLDGLSCGLLVICLMAFGVISAVALDTPLSLFIALWTGALIAFLYFNVWPARIILGDAGALSFGAMLGLIGLLTGSIIALMAIGGLFVIEILSSAVQILGWKILKRPILPIAPLHHTFLAIGWEEPKIVMRAWLAGIMLALFGVWLATI
jgi:phospho-N-acetylmuramoyl-pentapeptide-transferase